MALNGSLPWRDKIFHRVIFFLFFIFINLQYNDITSKLHAELPYRLLSKDLSLLYLNSTKSIDDCFVTRADNHAMEEL